MDDAALQRFGLAVTVLGATARYQEVTTYPHEGVATLGVFLLLVGVSLTARPVVAAWTPDGASTPAADGDEPHPGDGRD